MNWKNNKYIARIIHKIAADYRLKVPLSFNLLALAGLLIAIYGAVLIAQNGAGLLPIAAIVAGIILIVPRFVIATVLSRFQDLRYHIRDAIVHNVNWRGDEHVLDVGVGSGLTLFGCAKKLRSGRAIGIDLFLENSGGGTSDIFWKNAAHEGLRDRVELKEADARAMPFEDNCFDIVVSTSAFHHIGGADARARAAEEIVRVLKPGGQVLVYDLKLVLKELEEAMHRAGFDNVQSRGGADSALIVGVKPALS